MTNFKVACLIFGLLCLSTAVNSQCVTLYANYNQRGASLRLCESGNLPSKWDNRISSFEVSSGYTVQLYADADFKGEVQGPYNEGTYNVPANFNDQLSSIRIVAAIKCPTFFAELNEKGGNFQQCVSGNVPANLNGKVSSFMVPPGYTVQLYTNANYGGQMYGAYNVGAYNLESLNSEISSIKIYAVSKCPTFYADKNQGGDSFQQCSSGNIPTNWNNKVSSFVVPAGYKIQLYADNAYGGKLYGPYRSGSHNVPAALNDKLSSVKIFIVSA